MTKEKEKTQGFKEKTASSLLTFPCPARLKKERLSSPLKAALKAVERMGEKKEH